MNWPLIIVGVAAAASSFISGRLIYYLQQLVAAQKRKIAAQDETIAALRESVDLSDACGSIIVDAWNRSRS